MYDFAQLVFLDRFGCFFGREPLDMALIFFRPLPTLTRYFQWKNAHFTDHDRAVPETFFIRNDPTDRLPTDPITPASSRASRAAESGAVLPLCGQPFGMIQRCVPREVTSMISVRDLLFNR